MPGKFAALRESLGPKVSQGLLATKLGVSPATVGRMESPKGTSIDRPTFNKIAEKLGMTPRELNMLVGDGRSVTDELDPAASQMLRTLACFKLFAAGSPDDRKRTVSQLDAKEIRIIAESLPAPETPKEAARRVFNDMQDENGNESHGKSTPTKKVSGTSSPEVERSLRGSRRKPA